MRVHACQKVKIFTITNSLGRSHLGLFQYRVLAELLRQQYYLDYDCTNLGVHFLVVAPRDHGHRSVNRRKPQAAQKEEGQ